MGDVKYSVVIPVLNEVDNLRELLPRLVNPNCEVVVCDNGSTDGSIDLVENAQPNFNVRLSRGKGTVAGAIIRGLKMASGTKIIIMDGDLSHSPEIVPKMVAALDECDLVVGSRALSQDTWINRFISWGLNLLVLGLAPDIKDRVSGFFGIRRALASTEIRETSKPMLEFLVRGTPTTVSEVPYIFLPRTRGESKLGRGSVIPKTLLDVSLLYLHKFRRFVRYLIVGGVFTVLVFGGTYLLTELTGTWYMFSLILSVAAVEVFKFIILGYWAFGEDKPSSDPDYEWSAWYKGNPLQRYWKRKIGSTTKNFLGRPESILDVGCGSSPTINLFHCTRVGIDGDQGKLDHISKYSTATFIKSDLNSVRSLGSPYKAVICNNVLEHLENPGRVVQSISKALSKGGSVVLTVPNMGNPLTRLLEWVYGKVMPKAYAGDHIATFTPSSLDALCSKAGLKLVSRRSVLTDMVCLYVKT